MSKMSIRKHLDNNVISESIIAFDDFNVFEIDMKNKVIVMKVVK